MSYYSGQMGDYKTYGYAGDPGFLSSLWRGVKKYVVPAVSGALFGPVGAGIATAAMASKPAPGKQLSVPGTFGGAVTMPGGLQVSGSYRPGTQVIQPGVGRLPPWTASGAGVSPLASISARAVVTQS